MAYRYALTRRLEKQVSELQRVNTESVSDEVVAGPFFEPKRLTQAACECSVPTDFATVSAAITAGNRKIWIEAGQVIADNIVIDADTDPLTDLFICTDFDNPGTIQSVGVEVFTFNATTPLAGTDVNRRLSSGQAAFVFTEPGSDRFLRAITGALGAVNHPAALAKNAVVRPIDYSCGFYKLSAEREMQMVLKTEGIIVNNMNGFNELDPWDVGWSVRPWSTSNPLYGPFSLLMMPHLNLHLQGVIFDSDGTYDMTTGDYYLNVTIIADNCATAAGIDGLTMDSFIRWYAYECDFTGHTGRMYPDSFSVFVNCDIKGLNPYSAEQILCVGCSHTPSSATADFRDAYTYFINCEFLNWTKADFDSETDTCVWKDCIIEGKQFNHRSDKCDIYSPKINGIEWNLRPSYDLVAEYYDQPANRRQF